MKEINLRIVDLFCGAGGTSTGLIQAAGAAGKKVRLTAIDHWPRAIETHAKNHPGAVHLCENLDNINPRKLFPGGRLHLLMASPECTHHSNARGGRPCSDQSRSSAWHIIRWAEVLYIDNMLIENVPEFQTWGPLGVNGKPLKSKKGETFKAFKIALQSLGYRVDHRVLNSADYGDPTCRKRFFLIARRGNKKIRWPEITHTEAGGRNLFGETKPWVPARSIIDWSIQGQSIFNREKPLAEKTVARIEYGLKKFCGADFITIMRGESMSREITKPIPTLTTQQNMYLCQPFLARFHGGKGPEKRVHDIDAPLPVVDTSNRYGLIEYGLIEPEPFIIKYFGTGQAQAIDKPLGTITTKDRFGLVEVFRRTPGLDIRLRMLQPHELAAAQSFPDDYQFAGNKGEVVKQVGNAVPVKTARALCRELIQ